MGSQGTSKRKVYEKNGGGPCEPSDRNGIEIDLKTDGVERDGIETRKYNQKKRGKFQPLQWPRVGPDT